MYNTARKFSRFRFLDYLLFVQCRQKIVIIYYQHDIVLKRKISVEKIEVRMIMSADCTTAVIRHSIMKILNSQIRTGTNSETVHL